MNILTLASRNVYRSWRRSLVTTLAMAFACAIMILFATLMQGMLYGSERNVVVMNTGDIQIHRLGYRDDPDIYLQIPHTEQLLTALRSSDFYASDRFYSYGLMASHDTSSGVQLRGIDIEYETTVTQVHQHLLSGHWLAANDSHGVVIGKKLARILNVGLGGELVFIGQTADGFTANDVFIVRGILKSVSAAIDSNGVFIAKQSLQELISLPEGAHEIALMRKNQKADLKLATAKAQDIVKQVTGNLSATLEVWNWHKLMPVISRFLEMADVQMLIMLSFTYIAVASVILNAMLMSVFERIHEFGIMKAIGVSPWFVLGLVYAEILVQTFFAAALGLVCGSGLAFYLQKHGIDMTSMSSGFSFSGVALDPIWYAHVTTAGLLKPVLFLFVMAALAAFYPAVKAALLRPLDAIRYQ
jgi:ABC-type lipoprotein release transport system permease subunit